MGGWAWWVGGGRRVRRRAGGSASQRATPPLLTHCLPAQLLASSRVMHEGQATATHRASAKAPPGGAREEGGRGVGGRVLRRQRCRCRCFGLPEPARPPDGVPSPPPPLHVTTMRLTSLAQHHRQQRCSPPPQRVADDAHAVACSGSSSSSSGGGEQVRRWRGCGWGSPSSGPHTQPCIHPIHPPSTPARPPSTHPPPPTHPPGLSCSAPSILSFSCAFNQRAAASIPKCEYPSTTPCESTRWWGLEAPAAAAAAAAQGDGGGGVGMGGGAWARVCGGGWEWVGGWGVALQGCPRPPTPRPHPPPPHAHPFPPLPHTPTYLSAR